LARKKSWKKLRASKKFVMNIFGRKIVKEVLEFLLILAILYFGVSGVLALALRTDTYWMAVVSNSMRHDDESWREYFETRGYASSQFSIQGGFERGDMLIIQGVGSVTEIAVGEVIMFNINRPMPLVHRVVDISNENGVARVQTKGDGNSGILSVEKSIKPEQIRGKVIFVIPKLGYLSLWFQGS